MSRRPLMLWSCTLAVIVAAVFISAQSAARAQRSADVELQGFNTLVEQARTLTRLRAQRPAWTEPQGEGAGLSASVSASLAACGLPASALGSLSPENEHAAGGPIKVQRQRASLTLVPVTLPQLGGFLEAWRRRAPGWVVSSVDIGPEAKGPVAPGADLPLRAVLTVETLRLQNPGGDR